MILSHCIYLSKDLKNITFADNLPVDFEGKKIGKIIKTYFKDGGVWVDMEIDKDKVRKMKKEL